MLARMIPVMALVAGLVATGAGADGTARPVAAANRSGVFDVRDFGATGDGTTLDTEAIAKAIRAAAAAGGGTVVFRSGVYRTGTFELLSNVTLELQAGAVIQGSKNLADYAPIAAFGFGRSYGVDSTGEGLNLGIIVARNVENVGIVGRGVIDGSGDAFFDFDQPHYSVDFDPELTRQGQQSLDVLLETGDGPVRSKPEGRPGTMIVCSHCRNALIRDVTLSNAPNWTVHFNDTQGAVISGIHIANNLLLPNNDGFDCFGCRDVHFSDCDIRAGDDDFAIVNSEDVTVSNCSLVSRSSGIRLETTRNSTFSNLAIHSNRGLAVYGRGLGTTAHVLFSAITIETHLLTGHWWGKGEPIYVVTAPPMPGEAGQVSDVKFSDISGEAESGIVLYGSPAAPIRDVSFANVSFKIRTTRKDVSRAVGGNFDFRWTAKDQSHALFKHSIPGLYCRYVEGVSIRAFTLKWGEDKPDFFSSAIECEDFKTLAIDGLEGRQASDSSSGVVISLSHGSDVSIRDSKADVGTSTFLLTHDVSDERVFAGNDLRDAKKGFAGDAPRFASSGNLLPGAKRVQGRRP